MITPYLKQGIDNGRDVIIYDRNNVNIVVYIDMEQKNNYFVSCDFVGDEIHLLDCIEKNDPALELVYVRFDKNLPPRSLKDLADTMHHFYLTGE